MKQTAVEWLFAHLLPHLDWSKTEDRIKFRQLEQVALDMEKEQIVDAWDDAYEKGTRDRLEKAVNPVGDADIYYNETYKTEKMISKEEQKKLIVEIMQEDEKDGLYDVREDDVENYDVYKPLLDYTKNKYSQDRCMGFIDGYNKAKEILYTEEQMKQCWDACERYERPKSEGYAPNFEQFIQSLKQPK